MRFSVLFILLILSLKIQASGTYIVEDATIVQIANTSSNAETFTIWVSGGTGPCINTVILFPVTAAGSEKIYERAYSSALTAFASGSKVTIHNYHGADCRSASYIRLSK